MGPQLARADLAIRGSGEVLGYEQSGDKGGEEIGYEAYMEMLAEALVKGARLWNLGVGVWGLFLCCSVGFGAGGGWMDACVSGWVKMGGGCSVGEVPTTPPQQNSSSDVQYHASS
jgi:hypothetical protein